MSVPEIVLVADPDAVAERAADRFVEIVQSRQSESGVARVALSGGSTPRALFSLLASESYVPRIDWTAVDVFWGDERTVPPDHPDSNYRMARETLLNHVPIPEERIHRMRGELDPHEAAREYERVLHDVFGDVSPQNPPGFDLILLGLGGDGHTASLFPNTTALDVDDRLVVANEVPQQQTTRLTLTAPVLVAARNVVFLVTGRDKADAVDRAIEGDWDPKQTPAQLLRNTRGRLIWMLDAEAGFRLGPGRG